MNDVDSKNLWNFRGTFAKQNIDLFSPANRGTRGWERKKRKKNE